MEIGYDRRSQNERVRGLPYVLTWQSPSAAERNKNSISKFIRKKHPFSSSRLPNAIHTRAKILRRDCIAFSWFFDVVFCVINYLEARIFQIIQTQCLLKTFAKMYCNAPEKSDINQKLEPSNHVESHENLKLPRRYLVEG